MSNTKIYYSNRLKLIIMLLGSIIFCILIIFSLLNLDTNMTFKHALVTFLGLPFFAAGTIYILYRLIKRQPALIIESKGITVSGFKFLNWHEVSDIYIYKIQKHSFLGLDLKDRESFVNNLSPIRRFFLSISPYSDFPLVSISKTMLPEPLEEIINEINIHFTK